MTKQDLVRIAARKTWMSVGSCEEIVDVMLDSIYRALERGDTVQLRGFGTFKPKDRAARTGRNPHTGEAVPIPPRRVAVFKPSFELHSKGESK